MNLPLNIDWQQILLHLFNFTILAGGLYLLLYRPVKQFIQKREDYYRSLHEEAHKEREQAQKLKAEYKEKLAQQEAAFAQKQSQAQKDLDQMRSQQIAQAQQQAEAILEKARQNAQCERADIVSKATKELMDAAVIATEKIVLRKEGDPYDQFLDLAERRGLDEQTD